VIGRKKLVELIDAKVKGQGLFDVSKSTRINSIMLVLESLLDVIEESVLEDGHDVRLRNFGTFRQRVVAPRAGRNPQTGENISLAGQTSLTFSPAAMMRIRNDISNANKEIND